MQVVTKSGQVVPLLLNRIQDLELAEQSPMKRDQYVKPAQIGSTTLWAACGLAEALQNEARTIIIVSYDEDHASRLLLKCSSIYEHLREEIGGATIRWPTLGRENKNELFFPELKSTIFIGSARQYNFGRGEPIHMLIGSEAAFWPDVSRILSAAQDRVTLDGEIILESTPNGQEGTGEFFYRNYVAGKQGNSIYTSHFYPWWYHEEYQLEEGSQYALPADRFGPLELTEEEFDLCKFHDLNDDHIRWRRRKQLEKRQAIELGESPLLFQQEFPEDDINCWLVSGTGFYDSVTIERLAKQCYLPTGKDASYDGAAVWYPPEPNHDYLITIDPGMGKHSRTVIHVWETITDEDEIPWDRHCASSSGFYLESETCDRAVNLAKHYNNATIAPEANIPAVVALLVERRYPYLYMREDIISGRKTSMTGWLTTPKSKTYMFSEMARGLPHIITHDINLVSQLPVIRYVGDKVTSTGADDHHDAAAIYQVCKRSSRMGKSGYAGSTAPSNTWWSR